MATMFDPPHPGQLLREYVGDVQVGEAARRLRVARVTLSRILNGRSAISAEMALRLAEAFDTDPGVWLDMQRKYDLWHASRKKRIKIGAFHQAA